MDLKAAIFGANMAIDSLEASGKIGSEKREIILSGESGTSGIQYSGDLAGLLPLLFPLKHR